MPRRLAPGRTASREGSLLRRVATDPEAFAEFFERYREELLVYLTREVMDVEPALDLMSESFAIALERHGSFRGSRSDEERAWLYAIARNELKHYWRHGKIERRALRRLGIEAAQLDDIESERLVELAGIARLSERINGALSGLPPEQRAAVELRVVDELDYEAVAARLGISEASARARVSRGLRALGRAAGGTTASEAT